MEKTCCVTGHRPNKLGGYNPNNPIMKHVYKELYLNTDSLINKGYTTFISGMALGVDTLFAEIVIELKRTFPIKLVCAIPFIGQEKMWFSQSQKHYRHILGHADDVQVISPGSYSAQKMQIRNEWMVNHSSYIIAVWDGSTGGTGNCVRYAKSAKHQPEIVRIIP